MASAAAAGLEGDGRTMNLDAGDVDDFRRAVDAGAEIRVPDVDDLSLGAAFELAVAFVGWRHANTRAGMTTVAAIAKNHRVLDRAIDALDGVVSIVPGDYATPSVDIQPAVRSLDAIEWSLFAQRLRRSLEQKGGFDAKRALALSKMMSELVDNVIEQSSIAGTPPAPAVVGYAIDAGRMTFAIGDVGRGVLASLSDNPIWRDRLPDSRAAIAAAVLEHASRRAAIGVEGFGLRTVQQAVVDLDGSLRFRSGDAALTLDGPEDAREIRRSDSPPMAGFQVSVSCATASKY
jgi:hypothetical protein